MFLRVVSRVYTHQRRMVLQILMLTLSTRNKPRIVSLFYTTRHRTVRCHEIWERSQAVNGSCLELLTSSYALPITVFVSYRLYR